MNKDVILCLRRDNATKSDAVFRNSNCCASRPCACTLSMQDKCQTKPVQNTHISEPRDSRSHREFTGFRDNHGARRSHKLPLSPQMTREI